MYSTDSSKKNKSAAPSIAHNNFMTIRPEIEKIEKKPSNPLPRTCNLGEKINSPKVQYSYHSTNEAGNLSS